MKQGPKHDARVGRSLHGYMFLCGACRFGWFVAPMTQLEIESEMWFCPKCGHLNYATVHELPKQEG